MRAGRAQVGSSDDPRHTRCAQPAGRPVAFDVVGAEGGGDTSAAERERVVVFMGTTMPTPPMRFLCRRQHLAMSPAALRPGAWICPLGAAVTFRHSRSARHGNA